jgi:hypothetical protein
MRLSARRPVWALALVTALACAQAPERFAPAGISPDEARVFVAKLQAAVQGNDVQAIAAMTHFPLTVNGRPGARDSARFVQGFGVIFNDKVRSAVLQARVEDLFASYRGLMIGSGQVWISGVCADRAAASPCAGKRSLAIIAINNRSLTPQKLR